MLYFYKNADLRGNAQRRTAVSASQPRVRWRPTDAERAREEMQQIGQGSSEIPTVVRQGPNEGPTGIRRSQRGRKRSEWRFRQERSVGRGAGGRERSVGSFHRQRSIGRRAGGRGRLVGIFRRGRSVRWGAGGRARSVGSLSDQLVVARGQTTS